MWSFKRLDAWRRTRSLIVDCYKVTAEFPRSELFGLTSQIRRASNSIGANIAEGCARYSGRDRGRFLETSISSAYELEHHLLIASDLNLISPAALDRLVAELRQIRWMLEALRLKSLNQG
ncbi:MAG TPA: four helix bundle protein [Acidimicrobiia bacterium]|nr:four helix bundle protein [Acidimicrobiia bacterium]